MELKRYQQKAIQYGRTDGLLPITFDALSLDLDQRTLIVLKAITGSGKTVIASEYIERVLTAEHDERGESPICFIWLSKGNGMLHIQSSEKIKSYIKNPSIHVFGIENSEDFRATQFFNNDVYVINWEKLYKDNNLVTETENPNLPRAIKNTPQDMRFIFIVDEFHAGYDRETYKSIVNLFKPIILLGMSATPTKEQLDSAHKKVLIRVSDIQAEAMVKLGIKFNSQSELPDIKEYDDQDEYFLKLALARRDLLEKQYRNEGSNVVPLLLIQFDDEGKGKDVEAMIASTIERLNSVYSNNENNDYAIWMDVKKNSSIKRSEDNIIKNLDINNVKVLLFKQAIATGWDCPRAQVILRYRKIKDENGTFDMQTLGRIFRMPEPQRGSYYDTPALNYGYVYSLDNAYRLEQGFAESLIDDASSVAAFNNTKEYFLQSSYKESAQQLENLLDNENNRIVTRKTGDDELCDEIDRLIGTIAWENVLPDQLDNMTFREYSVHIADTMEINVENFGFEIRQTSKIREQKVNKLFREVIPSSYSQTVRDEISTVIKRKLGNGHTTDERNQLILKNAAQISELMRRVDEYNKRHEHRYPGDNGSFKFPSFISVLEKDVNVSAKSLFNISLNSYSKPEKIFISKLNSNDKVKFWFKNFDDGKDAFCVAYDVHNQTEPTYPDFLVAFNDGTFGIYEIKDENDITPEISNKKDGIEKRVRELNMKHNDMFHGTLFRVNIRNEVVVNMDNYPEFI
jgi:type III restriction enzyme